MIKQGIIAITQKGKVIFKCIACYQEENFEKLIKKIKSTKEYKLSAEYLFDLCIKFGFGNENNLAIQSLKETLETFFERYGQNNQSNLNRLFRDQSKFENPNFNPRWAVGTADFVEVIEL